VVESRGYPSTRHYAKGLFHCYDDPRIPQTTHAIETLNGLEKQ
jgi:hypothetical protein